MSSKRNTSEKYNGNDQGGDFLNLTSKIIPNEFEGSVSSLKAFIDTLDLLKQNATRNEDNAKAYMKIMLIGKVRQLITDNDGLDKIIRKLKQAIKGKSSEIAAAAEI